MKEKIKRILICFIIFNCFIIGVYAKGTLKVTTQIIPEGKTKKYISGNSLLIDAGILNSQTNIGKIVLAKVTVDMIAEATTNGTTDVPGIDGEFNAPFSMIKFKERKEIPLSTIKKYKGGEQAMMALKIENLQITYEEKINNASSTIEDYLFIAHQNEADSVAESAHALKHLTYTFDLSLEVTNVKSGDIIRSDVKSKDETGLETIGSIQDIVRLQFYGTGAI